MRDHTLIIEGAITLATIHPVLSRIVGLIKLEPAESVDLSGIDVCDSTALALLLELRRRGLGMVSHMPEPLVAIVHACQLDALFYDLAQNRPLTP